MNLENLLSRFSKAVQSADGTALAALFTEDGVYHDTFYGEFKGRLAIKEMLESRFYRDGERFLWDFYDLAEQGPLGYARWAFSYTSKMKHFLGKRVAFEGISELHLRDGLIRHYGEMFNGGIAFVQMGLDPARMEKTFRRWDEQQRANPRLARHFAG